MVRHRSLADFGEIETLVRRERPRHVYYSAGRYERPDAGRMDAKGWQGSDLIFDLDADHLPGIDPREATYAEMLSACKAELTALLTFLEHDFAFEDITVVFSGSRGYHVHVRDPSVYKLDREARREIVDYILGASIEVETIIEREAVVGTGRRTPVAQRRLQPGVGWSGRVHGELVALTEEIRALDRTEAIARLQGFDGIGAQRAERITDIMANNGAEIRSGNIDLHPAFLHLVAAVAARTVDRQSAAIDEPVTTDTHRLIRLPGSLHGGSGLRVREIPRPDVEAFEPLVDAIPETFRGQSIEIDVHEPIEVELGGTAKSLEAGNHRVPEYVGIFLMASGHALKAPERAT